MGQSSATLRLKPILASRSLEDLERTALLAARGVGFDYLLFSGSFSRDGASGQVAFDNFPEAWRRHCASRGTDFLPGSLRRVALQEVTPLLWRDASDQATEAQQYGLAAGVSCPVRGLEGQWSLSSFALARAGANAERYIDAGLPDCQLIACAIHYAASRVPSRAPDRAGPLRRRGGGLLSERECQCLIESARGKTTSEIGQILQISDRTVAFHLANARRKLDAANSRHAVTKALSLRLIAAS